MEVRELEARALEHERRIGRASGKEALDIAVQTVQLYLDACEKATISSDRIRIKRKLKEVFALAERIKKANQNAQNVQNAPSIPQSTRSMTTAEKTIIWRSSLLHNNKFPPWESAPDASVFAETGADDHLYTDPWSSSFSAEQQAIFAGWKRPADIFPAGTDEDGQRKGPERFMEATSEIDLAQDLATDCSVVASLCAMCAAVRHHGPNRGSLLSSLIYPFDHKAMRPGVSKNGKYVFRMNFNGCWRQVVIDDRLPSSSNDRTLYVIDRRNPQLIWPALVEKAYLKIRGGYDFPGSNSGTDLHALTGWIPEQIFFKSDDIELDETWDRIKKAFDQGNAILTLGTGNMSAEEEETLGLVKEHDYAVLDMREDAYNRLFLVKNPWYDSLVWTGVGSTAMLNASTDTSSPSPENMTNTFWMTFEDVIQHFDSLYVNWNPAIFAHRQDHHFTWEMPQKTEELVFTHNPQYSVLSPTSKPVWVLLSRHWQDGELEILRERKAERDSHDRSARAHGHGDRGGGDSSLANVSKQLGFTALALFATNPAGTRVPLAEGQRCLHQGPYVDSPNTLLRYEPTPGVAQTLVVAQGELPLPKYSFTLSFFSESPLVVDRASEALPYHESVSGAWTRRTAGGSAAHPSYLSNPQFALTLPRDTPLSLVLSTDVPDLHVHVAVLYSGGGQRVTSVAGRDVLVASAEYQRGCTYASSFGGGLSSSLSSARPVEKGTYTVVASTFEPGQIGKFELRVCAAVPITLRPVAPDAAGRLRTPVGGGPLVFRGGVERMRARVSVARLTRVSVHMHPGGGGGSVSGGFGLGRRVNNSSPGPMTPGAVAGTTGPMGGGGREPPLTVKIAVELGSRPGRRRVVAVSGGDGNNGEGGDGGLVGEFADASRGMRTGEVDLDPETARAAGGAWIVVERIGVGSALSEGPQPPPQQQQQGGGLHVEVLSDGVVRVGEWEVDES